VAYGVSATNGGATWGTWCATCHAAMHSTGNYVHPIDRALNSTIVANYNNYVSSGDMSGNFTGAHANFGPYSSLQPFASGTADFTVLGPLAAAGANTAATLAGPDATSQVMCLSCHRAHASAQPEALRWAMEAEFITVADAANTNPLWPGTDNGAGAQFARGRTSTEQQAGYYDRPATVYGMYQRNLCNKCHAKD
jgi:predicted CXXCH cytochrome family protein